MSSPISDSAMLGKDHVLPDLRLRHVRRKGEEHELPDLQLTFLSAAAIVDCTFACATRASCSSSSTCDQQVISR